MNENKRPFADRIYLGFLYAIAYAMVLIGLSLIVYNTVTVEDPYTRNLGNGMTSLFACLFATPLTMLILFRKSGFFKKMKLNDPRDVMLLGLILLLFLAPMILAALFPHEYA